MKSEAEMTMQHQQAKTQTQLAFTCSKLTKETLDQGVKYVQS